MSSIAECLNDTRVRSISCLSRDGFSSKCNCENYQYRPINSFFVNNTNLYRHQNSNQTIESNITTSDDVPLQIVKDCIELTGDWYYWDCTTMPRNLSKSFCLCSNGEKLFLTASHHIDTKLLYNGLENTTFTPEENQYEEDYFLRNIPDRNKYQEIPIRYNNVDQKSIYALMTYVFLCLSLLLLLLFFVYLIIEYLKRHNISKNEDKSPLLGLSDDYDV